MKYRLFRVRPGFIATWTAMILIAALLATSIELPVVQAQQNADPCSGPGVFTTSLSIVADAVIGIGTTNRFWRLCGIAFGGTSSSLFTWRVTSGTGTTCQTSTSDRTGTMALGNSNLVIMGYDGRSIVQTETATDDLCLDIGGASPSMQGSLSLVNAP